jgi:small subunit ribosomal protein S6
MFILDPREDLENLKNSVKEILKEQNGEILEEKEMGLKRLAYPINKRDKGFYYLVYVKLDTQKNEILKREFNLKDFIMRYIFINMESK